MDSIQEVASIISSFSVLLFTNNLKRERCLNQTDITYVSCCRPQCSFPHWNSVTLENGKSLFGCSQPDFLEYRGTRSYKAGLLPWPRLQEVTTLWEGQSLLSQWLEASHGLYICRSHCLTPLPVHFFHYWLVSSNWREKPRVTVCYSTKSVTSGGDVLQQHWRVSWGKLNPLDLL